MSWPFYIGETSSGIRPAPIPHAAIAPPFDQSDQYGIVHTTLPPEQVIPPHFTDPLWMRADFNGVTLDLNRWNPKAPMPLPFLIGANSTPLPMLMTPMAVLYPRYWQDAELTEHAERGYDDFIIAPDGDSWNLQENGFNATPQSILQWCQYVKSWGFRIVLWRGSCTRGLDSMFTTLIDSGVVSFYIHGKEVEQQLSGPDYDTSLHQIDGYLQGKIPIGAHFSSDSVRLMGYPQSAPDYIRDWSQFNGRVHLMQQLNVAASAGLQGASMYYGRKRVMGMGDGSLGSGAPDSRVVAFETMAFSQLYGQCDEGYGCLRDWELICGTRDDPSIPPVSGFGNGNRYPNGNPV